MSWHCRASGSAGCALCRTVTLGRFRPAPRRAPAPARWGRLGPVVRPGVRSRPHLAAAGRADNRTGCCRDRVPLILPRRPKAGKGLRRPVTELSPPAWMPRPASASIAQVHFATMVIGREVAVKRAAPHTQGDRGRPDLLHHAGSLGGAPEHGRYGCAHARWSSLTPTCTTSWICCAEASNAQRQFCAATWDLNTVLRSRDDLGPCTPPSSSWSACTACRSARWTAPAQGCRRRPKSWSATVSPCSSPRCSATASSTPDMHLATSRSAWLRPPSAAPSRWTSASGTHYRGRQGNTWPNSPHFSAATTNAWRLRRVGWVPPETGCDDALEAPSARLRAALRPPAERHLTGHGADAAVPDLAPLQRRDPAAAGAAAEDTCSTSKAWAASSTRPGPVDHGRPSWNAG